MSNGGKTILVTGATGQQGGATARHLLSRGWSVRGLTRNRNSSAAQALAEVGAVLFKGELDDRASLDAALDGVYGVYSFPNLSSGPEIEVQHGEAVADAAHAVGVRHFVQGSVGGAERNSGIPHFESKWQIEEYVRKLGLPSTFLRPAYFMENLFWKRDQILAGTYESMGLRRDKTLQMIAADDIGAFAAMVFEEPRKYVGQGLEIAGDELTESQAVAVMSQVIGRQIDVVPAGPSPDEDWSLMIGWFNHEGYEADIPALRKLRPELRTFETWLRETSWGGAA